jgi:sugar phosphate isomerase/epimerase
MSAPDILARLSLNQYTTKRWSLRESVEGCVRHGVPYIGVWRDKVAEIGLEGAAKLVRDAGLRVSSLCRGGFFPAASAAERKARIDDTRRAIEEAATLGAPVVVLVCGPPVDKDLSAARGMIADAIEALIPDAAACNVRLGIEPLHPMMVMQRSAICTLREANALAERFPAASVGVVVDVYHVWWDAELYEQIGRAGMRIAGFHISDWIEPLGDPLASRGIPGTGVIDLARIRGAVDAAGYAGPIEIEVLNLAVWARPGDDVLAEAIAGARTHL